jgi:bacterioferritin-associated ferredoxin
MLIDKHKLIKENHKAGCICKGIKLGKIMEAINNGARSFKKISEMTGIGNGSCKSKRCGEKVRELLGK